MSPIFDLQSADGELLQPNILLLGDCGRQEHAPGGLFGIKNHPNLTVQVKAPPRGFEPLFQP